MFQDRSVQVFPYEQFWNIRFPIFHIPQLLWQFFFGNVVQKGELPQDLPVLNINAVDDLSVVDVLVNSKVAESRSEAKRLIAQKGLEINDNIVEDVHLKPQKGEYNLRIGKRRFLKLNVN